MLSFVCVLLYALGDAIEHQGKAIRPGEKPIADTPTLRERLRAGYEQMLIETAPQLNYIKVEIAQIQGGYELYGKHSFFGRYSFDAGPLAGQVTRWYQANQTELKTAGIVRIGVAGAKSKHSDAYFELK